MNPPYVEFVSDLAAEGKTLRAIRQAAKDEDVELPREDEPLVRLMINTLYQEDANVEVLGSS